MRIFNVLLGQLVHTLTGHRSAVNVVAVSPEGLTAFSGAEDGSIYM